MIRGVVIHQWDGFFTFPSIVPDLDEVSKPANPTRWRPDSPAGVELPSKGVSASSPLDHINPVFGATVFFLAGIIKLHPALKWPSFLIGVGGAVLNYGAETAGAEDGSNWKGVGGGGGF